MNAPGFRSLTNHTPEARPRPFLFFFMLLALFAVAGTAPSQSQGATNIGPGSEIYPRAKERVFYGEIPGAKKGRAYASFNVYRRGKKAFVYLLGFCGEFGSGWVPIRSRRFRMAKTWSNGYGMKFSGKFTRSGKQARGFVKVWGPTKKRCNSGERRFVARAG